MYINFSSNLLLRYFLGKWLIYLILSCYVIYSYNDPVFQATVYLEIEFAVNPILRRRSEACRREAIYLAAGWFFCGNKLRGKVRRDFHGSAYRNCFLVTDVSRVTNLITHWCLPWPAYAFAADVAAFDVSTNFQQLSSDSTRFVSVRSND